MSADPAIGEYLNGKRGYGGVYNSINMNVYTYAENNPLTITDPDGNENENQRIENMKNALNRIFTGCEYKKEMLTNLKKNENGTYSTILDGKNITFTNVQSESQLMKDIMLTDGKTYEVLKDMMSENDLSGITISSLYRQGGDDSHGAGLGVDITQVVDANGVAHNLQDIGEKQIAEPEIAKKITEWLVNDKRIGLVWTPWSKNGKQWIPPDWRDKNASKYHIDHRHHFHIKIIK